MKGQSTIVLDKPRGDRHFAKAYKASLARASILSQRDNDTQPGVARGALPRVTCRKYLPNPNGVVATVTTQSSEQSGQPAIRPKPPRRLDRSKIFVKLKIYKMIF